MGFPKQSNGLCVLDKSAWHFQSIAKKATEKATF